MFINYLKIAFRNLLKHRFFSLLNILGLALGMASCLSAIHILRDQLSYDKFQPDRDRIYRVYCEQPDGMKLASVPYPVGDAIEQNYSQVEATVRLVRNLYQTDATTTDNKTLQVNGFYTEPSFFEVFGFKLAAGNPATALTEQLWYNHTQR
ncbi:MAG: ABC transporter permease [Saprospiraceae bacterium]